MKIITPESTQIHFSSAIVVSRFNEDITSALLDGAIQRLRELQMDDTPVVWVPGAVEIPVAAKRLALTGLYEVIITLGAVIQGDTDHYNYVCQQVSYGCQKVGLENNIPVIFGVLTTQNHEQAQSRAGGAEGNMGREAVDAAVQMLSVLRQIG